ncbi:hypothetical protein CKM354_001179100 [Cercospora kikuchii]|uniref:Uncharacterized protein n=1 Tax=Cercospora kikuchii TaxID=84275 RepID=A0A9P3CUC0_9PEZI|nr:uncharacterized protein CKM354_001179100 [Cercospora kikuchii]GIZ48741.1 hypothetical protein CKM354_001179100 [Cercospora kikuchii]
MDIISSLLGTLYVKARDLIGTVMPLRTTNRAGRGIIACGPTSPYQPWIRTSIGDGFIGIRGWPSRGGMIALDDATAVDFEFLDMNPLDPPLRRDTNQTSEDEFCQQLLLLGAKWYDSEERYQHVGQVQFAVENVLGKHENGEGSTPPTARESRWICVGWPSTGGLWVAEFDMTWAFDFDEEDLPPSELALARVRLARTMDERCHLLKTLYGATFYEKLEDYQGRGFLRAWEWKRGGEVGDLLMPEETRERWFESKGSRRRREEKLDV